MNGVVGLQALGLSVESLSGEALFGIDTGSESRHMGILWVNTGEHTVVKYGNRRRRSPTLANGRGVDPVKDNTGDRKQRTLPMPNANGALRWSSRSHPSLALVPCSLELPIQFNITSVSSRTHYRSLRHQIHFQIPCCGLRGHTPICLFSGYHIRIRSAGIRPLANRTPRGINRLNPL